MRSDEGAVGGGSRALEGDKRRGARGGGGLVGAVAWGESVVEFVTAENGLGGGWGRAKGWLDY